MRYLKLFALVGVLGVSLLAASGANAQRVAIGVGIGGPGYYGPAPICDYGYYNYYPYACAPYGYYGPEWFDGGFFIGAGPWFHGFHGRGFRGRDFDRGRDFRGRTLPRSRFPRRIQWTQGIQGETALTADPARVQSAGSWWLNRRRRQLPWLNRRQIPRLDRRQFPQRRWR